MNAFDAEYSNRVCDCVRKAGSELAGKLKRLSSSWIRREWRRISNDVFGSIGQATQVVSGVIFNEIQRFSIEWFSLYFFLLIKCINDIAGSTIVLQQAAYNLCFYAKT